MKLKHYLKSYNNSKISNLTTFIILIIIFSKINQIEGKSYNIRKNISFKNIITVKVQGKGEQIFISNRVIDSIQSLSINGKTENFSRTNKFNSEKELNEIIISINVKNFNDLNQFFSNCPNVTEIDLSNFNPIGISGMTEMFENCYSLTSINFGNLNTSQVTSLQNMFKNCKSLKSLNFPNFYISRLESVYSIFSGCINLVYLNLSNLIIKDYTFANEMFQDCSSLKLLDITNFDKNNNNVFNIFLRTPKDMIICLKEINPNLKEQLKKNCGDSWKDFQESGTKDREIFYLSCEGILDNINITNIFPNHNDNIETDSYVLSKTESNEKIDNDSYNNKETEPVNNIETSQNYNIGTIQDDNSETIISISEGNEATVSNEISTSLKATTSTISFMPTQINENINMTKKILEGDISSLLLNNELESFYEEIDNKKYQISTLSNQSKQNLSFIDLGYCETLLKSENNINITEELIIFKIENKFEGIKIPIIEYDIYSKDGKKLNLDICKNDTIKYFIPVSINENESFKYDPESNFYNNRCEQLYYRK